MGWPALRPPHRLKRTKKYDKLLHPQAFPGVIFNYQVLPDSLVNITAILLPWVELMLGLSRIINVWVPGSVVLGNLLLLSFFSMLIFNLVRGLDVSCGCFSTGPGEKGADYSTVLRDISILLVSGYLFCAEFLMAAPECRQPEKHRAGSDLDQNKEVLC